MYAAPTRLHASSKRVRDINGCPAACPRYQNLFRLVARLQVNSHQPGGHDERSGHHGAGKNGSDSGSNSPDEQGGAAVGAGNAGAGGGNGSGSDTNQPAV